MADVPPEVAAWRAAKDEAGRHVIERESEFLVPAGDALCDALEAERGDGAQFGPVREWVQRYEDERAVHAATREALRLYGAHSTGCGAWDGPECSCGFDAALGVRGD